MPSSVQSSNPIEKREGKRQRGRERESADYRTDVTFMLSKKVRTGKIMNRYAYECKEVITDGITHKHL